MADTVEKFGIENLKAVLSFGIAFGKNIAGSLEDGKFTFAEILALLPQISEVPNFIAKKEDILNELKDLSTAEIEELVASVEGAITNANIIATIEDALNIAVATKNLIERFKK